MPQRRDALTADELTAAEPATPPSARPRRKTWRLVADAPAVDAPDVRDRRGARQGMILLLAGGGLFWAVVAALVWVLYR
jgi:hypothetical protein